MSAAGICLSGKLLDENGLAPLSGFYSLVAQGSVLGQSGFVRVHGDHPLDHDGTFTCPPVPPGPYFLRFLGILRPEASLAPNEDSSTMQKRVFDFIYPNAENISEAVPFEVHAERAQSNLVVQVPTPTWFNIAGRVVDPLPIESKNLFVHFSRDMGILPDVGSVGFPIQADGSFTGMVLKGSYIVSAHKMTHPEPSGYTRSLEHSGSIRTIIEQDVYGLEVPRR